MIDEPKVSKLDAGQVPGRGNATVVRVNAAFDSKRRRGFDNIAVVSTMARRMSPRGW
ncbi:hypothetical protein [Mycobacterium basiliense]|uniref:hypothetical protein n=1 Tax=Mycobacterium basiliense TaxID=2094119 RepID=UPI0039EE1903